ncbi:helix-turn-helix domain-containing protein [Nocardia sp. NPDC051570]|uniref:helix-turn-helix domain-containing protein n=1 Tax=Nocardia sp. NPDC051570 TaxID=3364324 RepID=UPI0037AA55D7
MRQEQFAEAVGVSVEAVKKWERRGATITLSPPYAARMDRKLQEAGVDVAERFWSILEIQDTAKVSTRPAAMLESGALGMATEGALASRPLVAAFADSGVDHVRHFLDKRMTIIESDNIYGSAVTLPDVLGSIARMLALRKAKVVESRPVLRLLAMYAETAAWQFQDQRDFASAQHWAEKALTWSHQIGDTYCIGLSLVRMSQLACDMGDFESGRELAEQARRTAPPDSLFAAAAVTFGAHAAALDGDRSGSAHAYDAARTLVARATTDPAWGFFLDHSYIDAHHAHTLAELGRHATAAQQFADAIARMQAGYPRERGVYLARAAVAYMAAGEIEPAARLGRQALAIGTVTGSGRIMNKVITLAGMIDPASRLPGVGEFVEEFETWKDTRCLDPM